MASGISFRVPEQSVACSGKKMFLRCHTVNPAQIDSHRIGEMPRRSLIHKGSAAILFASRPGSERARSHRRDLVIRPVRIEEG